MLPREARVSQLHVPAQTHLRPRQQMQGVGQGCSKRIWQAASQRTLTGCCRMSSGSNLAVDCRASTSALHHPDSAADASERPISDSNISAQGTLELVLGPMFAGKTTRLIERMTALRASQQCAAVKSDKDVRYGLSTEYLPDIDHPNGFLHTHDGRCQACFALPRLQHLRKLQGFEQLQVILVDEGHFFEDLREFCNQAVDEDGKHVIVAGLDSDFERNPIGQVNDLCPTANQIEKLTARCAGDGGHCCNQATFTWRTVTAHQQELVGGKESYQALCRAHYLQSSADRIRQQRASLDDAMRS